MDEGLDPIELLRSYLWLPLAMSLLCLGGIVVIAFSAPMPVVAGGSIGLLAGIALNLCVYARARQTLRQFDSRH